MGLKQRIAGKKFNQDASNTPYIARKAPPKIEYDFWCSVMPSRDHGRMVFIIESGGAKVDEPDFRVQ